MKWTGPESQWTGGLAHWVVGDRAFKLPEARKWAIYYRSIGKTVAIGCPSL